MHLFTYTGPHPNFGDELNHWLWPRLLPDFFDDDKSELFLGIGSILYDSHPKGAKKIVFGAGYAGYTALPEIDDSWTFYFVRGKETAKALALPEWLAVGDSGILVRSLVDYSMRRIRHQASYIPHFESVLVGNWEKVCEQAGVHYIDPRWPVERVLEDMLASRLIISEAMHGIIIADALRIPWRAVEPYNPSHRAKWQDWASALGVTVDFTRLGPSNGVEWLADKLAIYPRGKFFLRKHANRLREMKIDMPLPWVAARLKRIASLDGQLSDDVAIERAHTEMLRQLEQLKKDYSPRHAQAAS